MMLVGDDPEALDGTLRTYLHRLKKASATDDEPMLNIAAHTQEARGGLSSFRAVNTGRTFSFTKARQG